MKIYILLCFLLNSSMLMTKSSSSYVTVTQTYSQNGKFRLVSIPFDNQFPTVRGRTSVYREGDENPLYVFDRGFDDVSADSNNLILSNNGEIIFYVIPRDADEDSDGLKSITIYRKGRILRSYTEKELTRCDYSKERCSLLYPSKYEFVLDGSGAKEYKKVLKEGAGEREKFLSDFPIFCDNDTVYITDFKKHIHRFDLKEGKHVGSDFFDSAFENIKTLGHFNRIESKNFESPVFLEFPNLADGSSSYQSLAKLLGMKSASIGEPKDAQYRQYTFRLRASIFRNGELEVEGIDFDDELPKAKIRRFFEENRFDASSVPRVFEKWYIGQKYFHFRKADDEIAKQEKREEDEKNKIEAKKRLTLRHINGVYIPQNLGECFVELDKLLKEVDRKEMQALANREDMIEYHFSLGMWLRNRWGLWTGSRLQTYFMKKGIEHPDDMSGLILRYYHDWLNAKKEAWREWEKAKSIQ